MKKCRENSSTLRTKTASTVDASTTQSSTKSKDGCLDSTARVGKKTWFEVLRQSPKKDVKRAPARREVLFNDALVIESRNIPRVTVYDKGHFSLALDDENFLQKLIEINQAFQNAHAGVVQHAYRVKHGIRSPQKSSRKFTTQAGSRNVPITDDDKFNFAKPSAERKCVVESRERRERQNLQVKATVKLLENMQNVSENSEVQLEALHNITQLIVQLREENKMLDKLKEMRIDLESKLASLSTENSYLTKRLRAAESERDKANRSLLIKEHEIDVLKKHIIALKSTIADKIDSSICDIEEPPEIPTLDETIASLPSNNQSFDAPIRPVSSSPVEDDHRWQRLDTIQSNSPRDDHKIADLLELKTNVKKTVDQFEVESVKLHDASLNLSDATFKLSSLSLV